MTEEYIDSGTIKPLESVFEAIFYEDVAINENITNALNAKFSEYFIDLSSLIFLEQLKILFKSSHKTYYQNKLENWYEFFKNRNTIDNTKRKTLIQRAHNKFPVNWANSCYCNSLLFAMFWNQDNFDFLLNDICTIDYKRLKGRNNYINENNYKRLATDLLTYVNFLRQDIYFNELETSERPPGDIDTALIKLRETISKINLIRIDNHSQDDPANFFQVIKDILDYRKKLSVYAISETTLKLTTEQKMEINKIIKDFDPKKYKKIKWKDTPEFLGLSVDHESIKKDAKSIIHHFDMIMSKKEKVLLGDYISEFNGEIIDENLYNMVVRISHKKCFRNVGNVITFEIGPKYKIISSDLTQYVVLNVKENNVITPIGFYLKSLLVKIEQHYVVVTSIRKSEKETEWYLFNDLPREGLKQFTGFEIEDYLKGKQITYAIYNRLLIK
jgi:hypothetical protein